MSDFRLRPIDVAGVRGRCAVVGTPAAPPVVLLASALARGEVYRATVEGLARRWRVYLVEMPGDGRSARLREPWELTDYAGWAAALLDALDLRGATLIGHSHSAGVALLAAALRPGRVERVVVADGAGAEGPVALWRVLLGVLVDAATVEFPLVAREWPRVASSAFVHPHNFFHQVRLSLATDLAASAAQVRVPVLLAWGARDHTTPPRGARRLAGHLPDATVYVAPRGGHSWLISHAGEFTDAVAAWIGAR